MRPGGPRQVVGLIGYPLRHSVSPVFQQAAFDFLGLPVTYEAWETPADRIGEAIARVRRDDCLGMNVTVPHKQAVLPLLDAVDERSATIGAVNTIRNQGGRLTGFNTDVDGFIRPLREAGVDMVGARAAIVGAGGAARAVAFALAWEGVGDMTLVARRPEQAASLAEALRPHFGGALRWGSVEANVAALSRSDLLVNCTSAGMLHGPAEGLMPVPEAAVPPGGIVYDLVYNPPTTPLLGEARRLGARTLGGLPMLVYQGAAAFELWTGQRPPVPLMLARAEQALFG